MARSRRPRLPLLVSDSDPELWLASRQESQLVAELDALGLICDDECCPAVHVDLKDVLDSGVVFVEEAPSQ